MNTSSFAFLQPGTRRSRATACTGITTIAVHHWGVTKGKRVGVVRLTD
jgi:hypothetical protein